MKKLLILGGDHFTIPVVDAAIAARQKVAQKYREALRNVPGIRFFEDMPGVRHNYSYFPIFIDAEEYGKTRDQLYFEMKDQGVLGRRYFFPLLSTLVLIAVYRVPLRRTCLWQRR